MSVIVVSQVFSDVSDIGTTANNFVKILAPAKPEAMGEAYIATGDDINCLYYNPAGMAKSIISQVSFTHVEWFQSVRDENISLMMPFSIGTFGFSLNYLSVASMDKTDASGVKTGTISPDAISGVIGYSKQYSDDFYIGSCLKINNYTIDPSDSKGSAMSLLVDTGLIYDMPFLKGMSAAITAMNIGMGTVYKSESFMQPITFRGGLGYSGNNFNAEADLESASDNNINYCLGGGLTLLDSVSIRGGWKGGTINQFTAGAGFLLNNFSIDYAFVPYTTDGLGVTHRITAAYKFGQPEAKLTCKPAVFSPNNDKYYDFIFFFPELMKKASVKSAKLTIYDAFKNPVRSYTLKSLDRLYWNGYSGIGTVVPDGRYYASLTSDYGSGVRSVSNLTAFEVDNTPPSVTADANPKAVKPGGMTTLYVPVNFQCFASDQHGIGAWKLVIATLDGRVFKTFSGKGEPYPVTWDGNDDTGLLSVSTGTTYTYTYFAMDSVGNWGRSETRQVKVLQREIVINLSADTLFDLGRADVKISVYQDIKKIADQIKGSGNPRVVIEGHTDNSPMKKGAYADNMELSQARAEAVAKFFVEIFDMDPKIFRAVGKGDTQPVATNDTPEGRKMNRRVTIRIQASRWE
jgi:flagellar motor protein MotB